MPLERPKSVSKHLCFKRSRRRQADVPEVLYRTHQEDVRGQIEGSLARTDIDLYGNDMMYIAEMHRIEGLDTQRISLTVQFESRLGRIDQL